VLVLDDGRAMNILVANLCGKAQRARIAPVTGSVAQVRTLDAASARHAMAQPVAFRSGTPVAHRIASDGLELELAAHAVAFVEIATAPGA
jgi:hypothetical protein